MAWNKWNTISVLTTLAVYAPMSFYIQYWLIKNNNPDRLIWFLFFSAIPIWLFINITTEIAKSKDNV